MLNSEMPKETTSKTWDEPSLLLDRFGSYERQNGSSPREKSWVPYFVFQKQTTKFPVIAEPKQVVPGIFVVHLSKLLALQNDFFIKT